MIQVYNETIDGVWFGVAVENNKVLATNYSFEKDLKRLLKRLPSDISFQVVEKPSQLHSEVIEALKEIFDGDDRGSYGFELATDDLSRYKRRVLRCTCLVPLGYVTSYGALAKVAGGSARSVGQVEATNPFPLVVPCHRVVCSDLSIGGYGYGKHVKLELLRREERGYEEAKQLRVGDGELSLFPAERVGRSGESF
jgi:methylated-DNA-[protein]-cysteine S-methyltransferase